MTGWNEAFPYAVDITSLYQTEEHVRWPEQRTWETMTQWLEQTLPSEWEYFNGEFRFSSESAKMLFLLRWT